MVKYIRVWVLIIAILLMIVWANSCSQPVAITDYKEIQCDDTLFMAWTTNVDTTASIQYCYNGKCYWTGDTEVGKLHTIIMPDYYHLTIWVQDKNGNRNSLEVK